MSNLSANIGQEFTNAILSIWYLKILNWANLGDSYLFEINIKQKQRSLEKSWSYFNWLWTGLSLLRSYQFLLLLNLWI